MASIQEQLKELSPEAILEMKRSILKELAKDDFASFCEYCFQDSEEASLPFIELQDFQREWCELIMKHSRLNLFSPVEFGKCLKFDTLIYLSNGSRKKVAEIVPGDEVLAMNDLFKIVPTKVIAIESNGYKELLTITTRSGRSISITPEHRFYILGDGWVRADRLKIKERIATPRCKPLISELKGNDPKIELLGYLISEGGLTGTTPRITIFDEDILARVKILINDLNWDCELSAPIAKGQYSIKGRKSKENRLTHWLRELNLAGCNSHTKFIPDCVFTASLESKAHFIAALFSGDGTTNKQKRNISYTSVSKQLIKDLQSLLLHFGIISYYSSRYTKYDNNKEFLSYRLIITQKDSIEKFRDAIPYLYPASKAEKLRNYKWDNQPGAQIDGVPVAWKKYQPYNDFWYREKGQLRVEVNNNRVTSREKLKEIALFSDDDKQLSFLESRNTLLDLAESDIFWDEIESIEPTEADLTYDLQVEHYGNFIADDFITHNSTLLTIAYPIWRLGNDRDLRVIIVSATYTQACKFLAAIKQHILDNKYVREIFPGLKPGMDRIYKNRPGKWSEDAITVERAIYSKDFSIQTIGVMGPLLNARCDLMILDDVITFQNNASIRQRKKFIEWFDSTAISRLNPNAQCIVVGTAWYSNDIPHYLEGSKGWTTVKYSVEPEDKKLGYRLARWKAKWPPERLLERKEHNEIEYDRTLRNIAKTAEAYPFAGKIANAVGSIKMDDTWKVVLGMDLSSKSRPGTCIAAIAYSDIHPKKVLLDIVYGSWTAAEKRKNIVIWYNRFHPVRIIVEANSLQDDMVTDYKTLKGADGKNIPVFGVITTEVQKALWLENLELELDSNQWIFTGEGYFDRFQDEVEYYPDYETTDGLMSLLFANTAIGSRFGKKVAVRTTVFGAGSNGKNRDNRRALFDFIDYRPFNRRMQKLGTDVLMPPNYLLLVEWIKKNQKFDRIDMTLTPPDNKAPTDYRLVLNEMIDYTKMLREN